MLAIDYDDLEYTPRFGARERELVWAVAFKLLKDEDRAHDATQDALLLAYRHRRSFRGDSRFSTWLYRIATTTALMHLRGQRRAPLVAPLDDVVVADAATAPGVRAARTPEEEVLSAEAAALAGARLSTLGGRSRRIFAMRFVEGYTIDEIAAQLQLKAATVKTRAYRARAALRRHLEATS